MSEWGYLSGMLIVRPLTMKLSDPKRSSPFGTQWSSTVNLLGREMRELHPTTGILEADFTESQLRNDGLPRATARPSSDGVILTLVDTPHGTLRYPCSTFVGWQQNVRAIALALEALRKVDRYGVTKRGEQYAGWKQLAAGPDTPTETRGARLVEIYGTVREALRRTHPDSGGDPVDFQSVVLYRDRNS